MFADKVSLNSEKDFHEQFVFLSFREKKTTVNNQHPRDDESIFNGKTVAVFGIELSFFQENDDLYLISSCAKKLL